MQPPEIDGYETICEPPHVFYVRRDWKPFLLGHLRDSFASVRPADRTSHADGRTPHFAYAPDGAPGRVFVRRAVRASAASFLGDLYLSSRRFFREIQACHDAQSRGLNVPDVVAARLTRAGPLFYRYMLVLREVGNARNLLSFTKSATPALKRRAAGRLGEAVRRMHEAGVYHGDLTLKNILVNGLENGLHIHFIDFDRARFEAARRSDLDVGNLSRLNRSVEKLFATTGAITRTDKMRFLLAYAGGRDEARRLARRCGRSLWLHRLWWRITGQR
ncbi:MAG: hypothetical protein HYY16_18620 [Planctomycetes bacterium]|nr:hypothetical protein [Planctomycetota bacterium]